MRSVLLLLISVLLVPVLMGEELTASFYTEHVEPIIAGKCVRCHGPEKVKSKLRLDTPAYILKGGSGGVVLEAGKPAESSLYTLITLPPDDPDVMPSKGDPVTPAEAELIRRWIAAGAPMPELTATAEAAPSLPETELDVLAADLPEPDLDALLELGRDGGNVAAISRNGSLLAVNLSNMASVSKAHWDALEKLAPHVAWLDCGGLTLDEAAFSIVVSLPNLRRLHLERSNAGDSACKRLSKLEELEYLNLVGTAVTDTGLERLEALPALRELYVWGTRVSQRGAARFLREREAVRLVLDEQLPAPPTSPE